MITRLTTAYLRYFKQPIVIPTVRIQTKVKIKMIPETFVYSLPEGEDQFECFFAVSNELINKDFNFCRPTNETVMHFSERVKNKLQKVFEKKSKKLKLQAPENAFDLSFVVDNQSIDEKVLNSPIIEVLELKNVQLKIMDRSYRIDKNPPRVKELKLGDTILIGTHFYPQKLTINMGNIEDSNFEWFVGPNNIIDSKKWICKNTNSFFFKPVIEDEGKYLKVAITPKKGNRSGLMVEAVSLKQIKKGPNIFRRESTKNTECFRIVTYNLLADLYADSEFSRTTLHPTCPVDALRIEYRRLIFTQELINYDADIICLQEVDSKVFKYDLLPVLSLHGFEGDFTTKSGNLSEGLAFFWKRSKFNKNDPSSVIFLNESIQEEKDILNKISDKSDLVSTFLKLKSVLFCLKLETLDNSGRKIILANTHLFFKSTADHIRLLQTEVCLRNIAKFSNSPNDSIIFCGDFNSLPTNSVYKYIRSGNLSESDPDWRSCPGQEVESLSLTHGFKLDSACGAPEYTNFTLDFKECIDYIFYDTSKFTVDKILPFPTEKDLGKAIPNDTFPSDHIACVADLKFKR